jgi:predicted SAM-dependent methyltransferase
MSEAATIDRTSLDAAVALPSLRLHIGCGTNLLPDRLNIDLVSRAPGTLTDVDITALPFPASSVQAILTEHVLEHLSFAEEALVWPEFARVLVPGGTLELEVPDFAWVCATFLQATDDWRSFYVVGHPDDYAGCGRALDQRWGILQTMFFGNQNGSGQFHKTAYTEAKLSAIARRLDFASISVERRFNKGGQALRARLVR